MQPTRTYRLLGGCDGSAILRVLCKGAYPSVLVERVVGHVLNQLPCFPSILYGAKSKHQANDATKQSKEGRLWSAADNPLFC